MDQNLRLLFDRALADEPEPPPDDLAPRAMAVGLRRRRRRMLAVGAATTAVIAAMASVSLAVSPKGEAPVAMVPARYASLLNPVCQSPARDSVTDVSVFLTADITDAQRAAVESVLRADGTVFYESNEAAYLNFRKMFSDVPAIANGVDASDLPESFRVKLRHAVLTTDVSGMPGVDQIIWSACPPGITVGVVG
jgi:hypothetical protein